MNLTDTLDRLAPRKAFFGNFTRWHQSRGHHWKISDRLHVTLGERSEHGGAFVPYVECWVRSDVDGWMLRQHEADTPDARARLLARISA